MHPGKMFGKHHKKHMLHHHRKIGKHMNSHHLEHLISVMGHHHKMNGKSPDMMHTLDHHNMHPMGHHNMHPMGHHKMHKMGHHKMHKMGHHMMHKMGHHMMPPMWGHKMHKMGHHMKHPMGHHMMHEQGHCVMRHHGKHRRNSTSSSSSSSSESEDETRVEGRCSKEGVPPNGKDGIDCQRKVKNKKLRKKNKGKRKGKNDCEMGPSREHRANSGERGAEDRSPHRERSNEVLEKDKSCLNEPEGFLRRKHPEKDSLNIFMQSIAEQVKDLTPEMIAQAKLKILEAVNELQLSEVEVNAPAVSENCPQQESTKSTEVTKE